MKLTENEKSMIDLFRAMNRHQKNRALALVKTLSEKKRGEGFRMETERTAEPIR